MIDHLRGHLGLATACASTLTFVALLPGMPTAQADNKRLNDNVFSQIFAAHRMNNCATDPRLDGRLVDAARRHAQDAVADPTINADVGSDGSLPATRASDAGFLGKVTETVAINPALAISGTEVLNQWWQDPPSRAAMQDCSNTAVGIWSENSLARSVVVAVYGQPGTP